MGDKTRPFFILWMLALAIATVPARADRECEQLLSKADSAYQNGRFDEALGSLAACLDTDPPRAYRVPVLALMAKVQLAIDDRAAASATISRLLRVDPGFAYDPLRDPPIFLTLVDGLRRQDTSVRVSSVSKTAESLREAPATVAVVTAEEIEQRGYLDLEALLHDLPGFDISRTNGVFYSNIYQRGYRSDTTNRTPVFIDGVQENDLLSKTVHLSRQYPVADVERVEVIYGPTSTVYGANSFAGVINVITKSPEDLLGEEGDKFAARVDLTAGSFNTTSVDAVVAGSAADKNLKWSLTGRLYRSDEPDLSRFPEWDFDAADYDSAETTAAYLGRLSFSGTAAEVESFLAANPGVATSPFFIVTDTSVELDPVLGLERVRALDKAALATEFEGRLPGFEDPTDDWLLHGKLELANVVLAFQTWRREEAWSPWRTDRSSFGKRLWIPIQTWFSGRYSRDVTPNLSLSFFGRYKQHEVDGKTHQIDLNNYAFATGGRQLGFTDLVAEKPAFWSKLYLHQLSTQFVGELVAVYNPSARLNLVSGLEVKDGSIAGSYFTSTEPNPEETGNPAFESNRGGNTFRTRDLGLYSQASYRPWERRALKFVAGGRFDHNEVRETGGYGTQFNPRLAVIYSPGDWVVKAIYSEAIQDASNFDKFNERADLSVVANPGLEPEKAKNFELAVNWQPWKDFTFDLTAFDTTYSDVVRLGPCDTAIRPDCTETSQQFRASGALEIRGLQAAASLTRGAYRFFANYTYTDPVNVDPDRRGRLRIGDIASHRFNVGANGAFWDGRLNLNLRANYVGARPTGEDTTDVPNAFGDEFGEVDDYFVVFGSVRYKGLLRGTDLQLIVNNLFDTEYYHPGIRGADGTFRPSRHPQPERAVYLRLSTSF